MTTGLDFLFSCQPPWVYVGPGEPERVRWNPGAFYSHGEVCACVRVLRGNKMRNARSLMDEFAAAFQFFTGFGENWIALQECLEYLDEWLPAAAYITIIERAEELLVDEPPDQLRALLLVLHDVGRWWSEPVTGNDRFNRKAIPFHSLLLGPASGSNAANKILDVAKEADVPVRL